MRLAAVSRDPQPPPHEDGASVPRDEAAAACFPLAPLPPHINARYDRLALVTEARHVAQLDAADDGTLIVSSDWLLWQQCVGDKRHAVHLDLGILDWDGKQIGHDHLVRANDWVYSGERDITLFRGVSLGRKFSRQIALIIADHVRLSAMLDSLIRRFQAKELVFFDYRTEDGFMDVEGRVATARAAADRAEINFVDRRQPAPSHESGYPRAGQWDRPPGRRKSSKARLWRCIVGAYFTVWGSLSLAKRRRNRSRPGVLMATTYITGEPLIDHFQRRNLTPMYLGPWMPHKANLSYWAAHFKNGILPAVSPRQRLDGEDLAVLADMEDRIGSALAAAAGPCQEAIRRYLKDHIIGGGEFRRMAEEVKWAERLVDDFEPALVITDGLMNATSLILLELTRRRGIPGAVTWHGPYVEDVKVDIFGCDPRTDSLADYTLTWGKVHEEWLDGVGATTTTIRTGNLVSSGYRDLPPVPRRGNVLVLQYVLTNHDFVTPMSQEYFYFVAVMRMLAELGFGSIRMRFHPGASKRKYYERLCDAFGLDCELGGTGAFRADLEWADIVIGPANSGAMLETIAADRPYYPVALKPHAINNRLIAGSPVFEDLESLRQYLESGRPLDQRRLLENFTSLREIPDAAGRTWDAIEGILGEAAEKRRAEADDAAN